MEYRVGGITLHKVKELMGPNGTVYETFHFDHIAHTKLIHTCTYIKIYLHVNHTIKSTPIVIGPNSLAHGGIFRIEDDAHGEV